MYDAEITLTLRTLGDGDKKMSLHATGDHGARGALLTGCIESNEEFRRMVLAALAAYFYRNPATAPAHMTGLLVASGFNPTTYFKK